MVFEKQVFIPNSTKRQREQYFIWIDRMSLPINAAPVSLTIVVEYCIMPLDR